MAVLTILMLTLTLVASGDAITILQSAACIYIINNETVPDLPGYVNKNW